MPDSEVVRVMRQHKRDLLHNERVQMREMARRWLGVERRLAGQMDALAMEMVDIKRSGGTVTPDLLYADQRYRELLVQLREETSKYSEYAERTITDRQAQMARLGIAHSQQAIASQVTTSFTRLPIEAVQHMVGMTGAGTPLRVLLERSWPSAVEGLTRELVNGVALGYNPRKTARMMAQGATDSLDRMMVIARTEQLRTYRQASLDTYRASSVVTGYRRLATHDSRVCAACLMDEGHFYELGETMPEHPQGRCAMIPAVRNAPPIEWKQGQEWFEEQSPATQKDILGKGHYYGWQNGDFELRDLVTVKPNDTWGDSLQVTPLKNLGAGRGAVQVGPIAPPAKTLQMAATFKPYVSPATGQQIESTYEIGRFGNIPIGYREMGFTGKLPDAEAMRKIADEVIGPALSRVPATHSDLIDYIMIQDFDAGFAMGGHADGRGIAIDAIRGQAQIGPSGIVHEVGHLVHQRTMTDAQARLWAEATGWDDLDTALDMMRNAKSDSYKPYEYIGATEYGTFHPVEAFAESYRLKYQGNLDDLDGLIVYPERRGTLGALLDRILE